jgi:hypothetical protein
MNPAAWTKSPEPVFQRTEKTFGVGHNCFVTSPDGREDWLVYHAKVNLTPGWQRTLRLQPFTWRADGTPDFGTPVTAGLALRVPSGQRDLTRANTPFSENFRSGLGAWDVYAHPQYVRPSPGELRLGHPERDLVNAFRSGEKILLRDHTWTDARFAVRLRVTLGGKPAGLLFRAASPAVGHHAQRAYFAGISTGPTRVILAYSDGATTTELASAPLTLDPANAHTLEVTARGPALSVTVDGQPALTATDARLTSGQLGLRIDDGSAIFESVTASPLRP